MSETQSLIPETKSVTARNIFVGLLFGTALVLPRLMNLRQNRRAWTLFRLAMAAVGAGMVILPLTLRNGIAVSVFGLMIFVAAILIPSAKPSTSVEDKTRELGALVVVNGGKYQPGNAPLASVQIFVGNENIWVLDLHLQPLLVIPTQEIIYSRAEYNNDRWLLRIRWSDRAADFLYQGFFAEHLARVAERTVSAAIPPALPVLPQRRAASA
jgi:hypothetical protein